MAQRRWIIAQDQKANKPRIHGQFFVSDSHSHILVYPDGTLVVFSTQPHQNLSLLHLFSDSHRSADPRLSGNDVLNWRKFITIMMALMVM